MVRGAIRVFLWGWTVLAAGCALTAPFDPALAGDGGTGQRTFADDQIDDGDQGQDAGVDAGDDLTNHPALCDDFCNRYVECQPDEAYIICFAACICIVDQMIRPDALEPVSECLDAAECDTVDPFGTCSNAGAAAIQTTARAREVEASCLAREQECAKDLPCEVALVVEDAAVDALAPCVTDAACGEVDDCAKNALLTACE